MVNEADIVSAIHHMVQNMIDNSQHAIVQGTWEYALDVDPDLSVVTIGDQEYRYVRKASHVTGLVAGDAVLMQRSPECPLIIIAKIVGDITLAGSEL